MSSSLYIRYSFLLGFSSAASQILVMRALASALYGNELIFILALVGWLIGIASGSAMVRLVTPIAGQCRIIAGTLILLSGFLIPATILIIRFSRSIFGISPGMLMDITQVVGISLAAVFPLSVLLGALFPVLTSLSRDEGKSAAQVYLVEAIGFIAGGILMTFVFLPFADALTIAVMLTLLHVLAAAQASMLLRKTLPVILITGIVVIITGILQHLDKASLAAPWKGFTVVESRDSIHGQIQLVEKEGTRSLFENGILVASSGDALSSEENVHYALLAHRSPRTLLLIGGGLGGGLEEALKYPGLSVDYVELDPAAIDIARRNIPDVERSMDNPRVRVVIMDGRRFVKQADRKYDVIILNLSDPLTLLVNRYYTEEFFREARRCLAEDGILSLSVTSSENYLGREGQHYLRVLRRTLGMVFAEVRSIPGDRHIFLASPRQGAVSINPSDLSGRLKERGVRTQYVRDYYFNTRLAPGKVLQSERALLGKAAVNSDTRPSAFLAALVFWSTHFRSGFVEVAEAFRLNGRYMLFLPVLAGILALLTRKSRLTAASFVACVAGGCLMLFQVAIMLAFQSFYGFVYAGIGILTAVFMAGAAVGARWADRVPAEKCRDRFRVIVGYAALFAFILAFLIPRLSSVGMEWIVLAVIGALSLAAGFFGGALIVLAIQYSGDAQRNAGIIYAADVIGAAIGALFGGILLIPLWGIDGAAAFCGLIQLAVILAIAF